VAITVRPIAQSGGAGLFAQFTQYLAERYPSAMSWIRFSMTSEVTGTFVPSAHSATGFPVRLGNGLRLKTRAAASARICGDGGGGEEVAIPMYRKITKAASRQYPFAISISDPLRRRLLD
jgi:hypothetical protein